MRDSGRGVDLGILALGVLAVSTAAVLIREAQAPSLVIAAARLGLASAPLLGLAAVRRMPLSAGSRESVALTILAGVFLAAHFAFWVASVKETSIITSVVLVTAQPLFVALASGPLLGEKPSVLTWLGIAIAGTGAAAMVAQDIGAGSDALRGDLFALLGAIFAAAYIMTGRRLRTGGQDWLPYVTRVYSVSAVILIALALASGHGFAGYSSATWLFLALLALVPQLVGHTALNRSLGYLPAASVAIAILGEPVGATILGVVLLDEEPTAVQALGGALVLAGVYVGLRGASVQRTIAPQP